ncbi:unnamed protein product [Sphenostylis stenocarpa]|uniref:Metallothionein-like protein n=1 Tax=Sphenostylis stenocarpa TaxID=92480 RepID=A0AA86SAQ3_9FABA|nr:unnamed protein product [Sphenostylis stenocarpa]
MSGCGSNCGCGSSCSCGSNCGCSKYSFDMSYAEKTTTESLVLGVGPVKPQLEGAEMGVAAEDSGCKCGSNCTCDPCNCNPSFSSSILKMSGCGCGSSCNCGSNCSCGKKSFDMSYTEKTTTESLVLGVGPVKPQFEGAEMGVAAEDNGCKCGSNCTCDPCNCKCFNMAVATVDRETAAAVAATPKECVVICKLHPTHVNRNFVLALEAVRSKNQGAETSVAAENSGCKCGPNCTCDPCNCK